MKGCAQNRIYFYYYYYFFAVQFRVTLMGSYQEKIARRIFFSLSVSSLSVLVLSCLIVIAVAVALSNSPPAIQLRGRSLPGSPQ